jgi:hypothetical protein
MPKLTTGRPKAPQRTYTYWLTRDTEPDTGALSPEIRVWLSQPSRRDIGRGRVWSTPDMGDLYGQWTIDDALYYVRTYPDDDRQCIRVAGDVVKQPGDAVLRPKVTA